MKNTSDVIIRSYFDEFTYAVKAEFMKLKRSYIWLAVLFIPILGVFLGSGNYSINAAYLTGNPWTNLWTQVALFFGYFFYPFIIAVIAGYLFRVEHFENNWNILMTTPIPPSILWFSKLLILFFFAIIIEAIEVGLYIFSGIFILKLSGLPDLSIFWSLIGGPICVMSSGVIQLYLSMRIKSFALPPAISIVSCVIGLGCYAKGWWFYPNTLAIIGINAQHMGYISFYDILRTFSGTLFWVLLFSYLAIVYLKKHDVN